MDFAALFRILLKRAWILILVPLVTAGIAYYILKDLPRLYRSTAQVATGFTTNEGIQLDDSRYNPREADIKFQNLLTIFKSPSVVNLLGYRLIIHDLKEPKPFKDLRANPEFRKYYTEQQLQDAVAQFQEKLNNFEQLDARNSGEVELIKLTKWFGYNYSSIISQIDFKRMDYSDYVAISYLSGDPELSAFAVNTFVDEFQRYNRSTSDEQSGRSLEFYANLVDSKRKILDDKTQSLRDFQTNSNMTNPGDEADVRLSQISNIEAKIQEAESDQNSYRIRINELNKQIRRYEDDGGNSGNNARIIRLENTRDRLNSEAISASGVRRTQIQDSLTQVRQELNLAYQQAGYGTSGGSQKVSDLKSERDEAQINLQVANSRVRQLKSDLARLNYNKSDLVGKSSIIDDLNREVALAEEEYKSAQDRYNNAKNVSLAGGTNVRKVMPGQPPLEPEASKKLIFTILAGVVSFALCFGVIVLVFMLDGSIKTSANFERMVDMPVLGALNQIAVSKLDLYDLFHKEHKEQDLEMFKQSLRKLRFELEESKKQSFLFTSTQKAEGKSFIVLTLAYSMSLLHKKVLIIDTNFKHNTLTTTLLVEPQKDRLLNSYSANGRLLLADNMANGNTTEETAGPEEAEGKAQQSSASADTKPSSPRNKSFISPTHHANIDIIGSHVTIASPAEILSGRSFKALMEELKHHYDYILLEGAALNDYPDSKELTRFVDGVVTVFSANSSIHQPDRDSIKFIKSLNGRMTGAVVNQIAAENMKV